MLRILAMFQLLQLATSLNYGRTFPFFFVDYRMLSKMGEGTFSEVLKCQNHVDGQLYACKRMKQKYES